MNNINLQFNTQLISVLDSKASEESFVMTADTVTVDNENRLHILKMINMCETNGQLLDTRVIDQLLSVFNSEECFVCPTYSTIGGQMAPYYGKWLLITENGSLLREIHRQAQN